MARMAASAVSTSSAVLANPRENRTVPLGNPALTAEDEYALRYKLVDAAIKAFSVEVDKQTVFDV